MVGPIRTEKAAENIVGVLLNIPAGEQDECKARAQSNYPLLFASDRWTAESLLPLISQREDH